MSTTALFSNKSLSEVTREVRPQHGNLCMCVGWGHLAGNRDLVLKLILFIFSYGNLPYSVVLISAVLQLDSVIVIYIPPPPEAAAAESRALCSGSTSACWLCSPAQDSTH